MSQTQIVILRRDFLEIVGDFCAAKILEYMRKWGLWKIENHRTFWVYQPVRQIRLDLLCEYSEKKIRQALALLENLGLLEKRNNPGNGQDKTYQYKLNFDLLNQLLESRKGKSEVPSGKTSVSGGEFSEYQEFNTKNQTIFSYPCTEEKNEQLLSIKEEIPAEIKQETQQEIQEEIKTRNELQITPPRLKVNKNAEREKFIWEAEPGRPYEVFLKWWARKVYEPQGGHWKDGALYFSYQQFYKNPDATTNSIFPQFMEHIKRVTDNANQRQYAGMAAVLPSEFVPLPQPTEENLAILGDRLQTVLNQGEVKVALPDANTGETQTLVSLESTGLGEIQPLPQLQPAQPPSFDDQKLVSFAGQLLNQLGKQTKPQLTAAEEVETELELANEFEIPEEILESVLHQVNEWEAQQIEQYNQLKQEWNEWELTARITNVDWETLKVQTQEIEEEEWQRRVIENVLKDETLEQDLWQ